MDDRKPARGQLPSPARKKHRVLKALAILVLLAAVGVAGLPWLMSTPAARSWIVARVNARLAPGSVHVGRLGLSWAGPIELDRVALVDPKGKTVLAADRVTLDRGILGLLASRPDYGTVTIEGATIDLERKADGTIDLLDALASVMKPDLPAQGPPVAAPMPAPVPAPSPMAITVIVKGGTLKVAGPELVEPFEAGKLDGSVTIAPGKPIEVSATLGGEGRSLDLRSTIDAGPSGDLHLSVVGKDWPLHVRQAGVEAKGRFVGTLEAKRDKGLWSAKGDAVLDRFEAAGPSLQGDRLTLDRVVAGCDVAQSSGGWAIRKLDLTSPVASLRGNGTIPAADGTSTRVEGKVDLALLAKMLPNAMRLRDNLALEKGTATLKVDVTATAGVDRFEVVASLDDFAANEAGRDIRLHRPVYLSSKATRSREKVTVETMEVKAAGIDVTGGGDLEAGVKLAGTVNLVPLTAQLRDVLDLGALDLSGHARLAADYRHINDSYKGRFAVEFKGLKIVGATAEPIERALARLDGWAVGPSHADGTPNGWEQARLDLKAGDLKLDAQATSNGENPSLIAGFEMLVASPIAGRFDAKAKVRKAGTAIEIDELIAGITPTDPKAAQGVVALAVKGKFDPASGEGTFGPIPGKAVGAIGIGPDGAKVSGLGRTGMPLKVDAALTGDLEALDRLLATWQGSPPKGLGGLWATQASSPDRSAASSTWRARRSCPTSPTPPPVEGRSSSRSRPGISPNPTSSTWARSNWAPTSAGWWSVAGWSRRPVEGSST